MDFDFATVIAGLSMVIAMGTFFATPWRVGRVEKDVEMLAKKLGNFETEQKQALVLLTKIDTRMEGIRARLDSHSEDLRELKEHQRQRL